MGVAHAVHDWLHVVAGHVGFDECVATAVETLSTGYHWPLLAVASAGPLILTQPSLQRSCIRATCVLCATTAGLSSQQWLLTPWQHLAARWMGECWDLHMLWVAAR